MTYCVYYKNEFGDTVQTLILGRVKRHRNKELIILMEKLTEAYYLNNASLGQIIADDNNWEMMKQVASMIPVVGQKEDGFDIERISDDYSQLTKLFFTTTYDENEETDYTQGLKPSIIGKMHDLNWGDAQKKAIAALKVKEEKELDQIVQQQITSK